MPSSSERPSSPRPRATVLGAFLEGWRRVMKAPGLVLTAWVVTTLVTLPLAAVLHEDITTHLGSSTTAERALQGWDPDWPGEFTAGANGVAETFTREILGATVTVATISRILGGESLPAPLVAAVVLYLIAWIFLSGGIIDRLARARPLGAVTVFSLSGAYFFRLLRLAMLAGVVYWFLFRIVHPLLFQVVFDRFTRDLASESQAMALLAGMYVVFALLLGLVNLVFDFTRVRLVVEDRRSAIAALGAGLRFVRRRPWRSAGLWALNFLVLVIMARLWLQLAIGAGGPEWPALLVSQVYLVARIWGRLAFLGSETVFFQGELAHAQYTAAPLPRWPDSASVEAVRNLRNG